MKAARKAKPPAPPEKEDAQARMLARMGAAARRCQEVEAKLRALPAPELDSILRLHRRLILQFSLEAEKAPDRLRLVKDLMKPVMDWARLEQQRKGDKQAALAQSEGAKGLKPETLDKIERELRLL